MHCMFRKKVQRYDSTYSTSLITSFSLSRRQPDIESAIRQKLSDDDKARASSRFSGLTGLSKRASYVYSHLLVVKKYTYDLYHAS